jgi:hypothetical protein
MESYHNYIDAPPVMSGKARKDKEQNPTRKPDMWGTRPHAIRLFIRILRWAIIVQDAVGIRRSRDAGDRT